MLSLSATSIINFNTKKKFWESTCLRVLYIQNAEWGTTIIKPRYSNPVLGTVKEVLLFTFAIKLDHAPKNYMK